MHTLVFYATRSPDFRIVLPGKVNFHAEENLLRDRISFLDFPAKDLTLPGDNERIKTASVRQKQRPENSEKESSDYVK